MINTGLEGVVVAETALSMVDGERGELIIAGWPVGELAPGNTFEQTVALLWSGETPGRDRALRPITLQVLRYAAEARTDAMDALRMATATLVPEQLFSAFPTIVAAFWRLLHGREPVPPRDDLSHAANYLFMLRGELPGPEHVRALDTYLNTVVDHGMNASTFTARVITSTGSDLVSAITGAIGALKGPLHGGAPGPALEMVLEIGEPPRAEAYLRGKLESGERLMGFGHRVYKVRDPRADVLAAAAERLYREGGDLRFYELAKEVERTALRLLEEAKPGRRLQTNVEFYTALLLHGIGLEPALFTPTFAVSRVAGWIAHCLEQRRANRLIRPQSVYVGPKNRALQPS